MDCRRCGSPVVSGSQRCSTCGTRSYLKDPFQGITDFIMVEEMKKRDLWAENQERFKELVEENKRLNHVLRLIEDDLRSFENDE